MPEPTVCLILEGSYPFVTGGVSAWVQELIMALPDVRFVLYTLSPKRDQPIRYTLPPNVVGHKDIVLHEKRPSIGRPPRSITRSQRKRPADTPCLCRNATADAMARAVSASRRLHSRQVRGILSASNAVPTVMGP